MAFIKRNLLHLMLMVLPKEIYIQLFRFIGFLTHTTLGLDVLKSVEYVQSRSDRKQLILICTFSGLERKIATYRRIDRIFRGPRRAAQRMGERYGIIELLNGETPDLTLDIGANIGEFAEYISEFSDQVIAFEPDPIPFECLAFNLAKFPNVMYLECALAESTRVMQLYLATENADTSLFASNGSKEYIDVQAFALPDLPQVSSINGAEKILVKIDAEGYEPEVLKGFKDIIHLIKWISIDVGPERNGDRTETEVKKYLEDFGFITHMWSTNVLHGIRA
jgi:FkbM family methyltransferase